jgi:hypothetical protein
LTAIVSVIITEAGLPPALEVAQRDPDLTAGTHQTSASGMCLADEFDRLLSVSSVGQPSACSEQKATHFFRGTSKAGMSAITFSLRCSFSLIALILCWCWARIFSSSFGSYGSASSPDCV